MVTEPKQNNKRQNKKKISPATIAAVIAVAVVVVGVIIAGVVSSSQPVYKKDYSPELLALTDTTQAEIDLLSEMKNSDTDYHGWIKAAVSNEYNDDAEEVSKAIEAIQEIDGVVSARFVLKETSEQDVAHLGDSVETFPYLKSLTQAEYAKAPSYIQICCDSDESVGAVKTYLLETLAWRGICPSPPTPEKCIITYVDDDVLKASEERAKAETSNRDMTESEAQIESSQMSSTSDFTNISSAADAVAALAKIYREQGMSDEDARVRAEAQVNDIYSNAHDSVSAAE